MTSSTRTLIGGSFGTFLEWYDYTLYGFLSVPFAKLFFPSHTPKIALIETFGIFAIGYLARPIGGLFLGFLGDRLGRKWALVLSIFLMGLSTLAMGCLPTYTRIGVGSPLLLLAFRLLQGLSVGGEYMSAAVFLVEHAPPRKRGFFGSMNNVAGGIGCLVASAFITPLTFLLKEGQLLSWGWRLPFFLGAVSAVAGIFIRLKLEETPIFKALSKEKATEKNPIRHALRSHPRDLMISCGLVCAQAVSFYVSTLFLLSWFVRFKSVPYPTALFYTSFSLILLIIITAVSGYLSDLIGRKILLSTALLLFLLFSFPIFSWMSAAPSSQSWRLWVGQALLATCTALYNGAIPSALVGLFSPQSRCTGVSLSYNLAAGVVGGLTPLIATSLILFTHLPSSPAFLLTVASLFSLCWLIPFKESAPRPFKNKN